MEIRSDRETSLHSHVAKVSSGSAAIRYGIAMLKRLILVLTALASPAAAAHHDTPDIQLAKALTGRVAGTPVSCIDLSGSDSTQIIDGKAIIYRVGGRLYVNEPRSGASTLRSDDILVTRTYGSQLCSIDMVRLIDRGARFPRGFVSLGQFVPYSRVKPARG